MSSAADSYQKVIRWSLVGHQTAVLLDSHQGFIRSSPGSHQEVNRQSPGSHQAVTRQSPGSHQVVTRKSPKQSSGSQIIIRQSSISHRTVIRLPIIRQSIDSLVMVIFLSNLLSLLFWKALQSCPLYLKQRVVQFYDKVPIQIRDDLQ